MHICAYFLNWVCSCEFGMNSNPQRSADYLRQFHSAMSLRYNQPTEEFPIFFIELDVSMPCSEENMLASKMFSLVHAAHRICWQCHILVCTGRLYFLSYYANYENVMKLHYELVCNTSFFLIFFKPHLTRPL